MGAGKKCPHIVVAGCGAAGMMAALCAAETGAKVTVLEKNEKAGKKLYISGKGRCNLTNDCGTADFFGHVIRGGKFLYSAVYGFDTSRVQRFFSERGCPLKTERGNRVFPVSDKSSDVIKTLVYEMRRLGVDVRYDTTVKRLLFQEQAAGTAESVTDIADETSESGFAQARECGSGTYEKRVTGVRLASGEAIMADAVILATGGLSYPSTGSTGDGYAFARAAGHTVSDTSPSLVPFETREDWCRALQGLTLKNVRLYTLTDAKPQTKKNDGSGNRAKKEPVPRFDEQGELLFTHFGVSGPLVLTASAMLNDLFMEGQEQTDGEGIRRQAVSPGHENGVRFAIDLKPALTAEQLDARLIREFTENGKKKFANSLDGLFPASLIPVMVSLAEAGMRDPDLSVAEEGYGMEDTAVRIAREQSAATVTAKQRRAFGALIKRLPFTVTGTRGFNEAVVTRGGVALKEVNPKTMESKLCKGLYFAGEMLDCDALTGGFNLQIAWSTGYAAGNAAADRARKEVDVQQ